MIAIKNWLLGESPQAWIEPRGLLSPEQSATLKALLEALNTGTGVTPYTGDMVAPMSDLEGLSLEALEQKIMQRIGGQDLGAESEAALQDVIKRGGAPTDWEQYYQTNVLDPSKQEFIEQILPEVTRKYGSSGAFGSDKKLAEQQALERLGKTLAGTRASLAFQTQESAADRLLRAIGQAPGLASGNVQDLLALLQGSALPRNIEQARRTAEYGEFTRQQDQAQQRLNNILNALGVKTVENLPLRTEGTAGWLGKWIDSFVQGTSKGSTGGGFFGG